MRHALVFCALLAAPLPSARVEAQSSAARTADTVSRALVARGDSIFHGKVGGALCATCHGVGARGVKGMGPSLADGAWLHGDGSEQFLLTLIRAGVPRPKESPVVMPPFGGVPLNDEQLRAVAAYVRSLRAKPAP